MAKRTPEMPKIDFEKMLQKGEHPKGFVAQTANGTAHWEGTGWNRDEPYGWSQVEPKGPWKAGRSTRTGE